MSGGKGADTFAIRTAAFDNGVHTTTRIHDFSVRQGDRLEVGVFASDDKDDGAIPASLDSNADARLDDRDDSVVHTPGLGLTIAVSGDEITVGWR